LPMKLFKKNVLKLSVYRQ